MANIIDSQRLATARLLLKSSPVVNGYNLMALKMLLIVLKNGKAVNRGKHKDFIFSKRA